MHERRRHARHSTQMQLEVFERASGERLGRLVDLSLDGFMLFSEHPLQADQVVECSLNPSNGSACRTIEFAADCLWSRPGADGQHCWAGYHIIDIAEDQAQALQQLLTRF
jgi:hypothetical protein